MKQTMKEANKAISEVAETARREALDEVLKVLVKEINTIIKLMQNGRPILETANGWRFDRLFEMRQRMWSKLGTLNRLYAEVALMRYKK